MMLQARTEGVLTTTIKSAPTRKRPDGDRRLGQEKSPAPETADPAGATSRRVSDAVQRLLSWLPSLEVARKGVSNILTIVLLGLAVALLTQPVVRRAFIVTPINLPKPFEDLGYNGAEAAQRILDEVHRTHKTATTTQLRDAFSLTSPENDLPNIQIPFGGISLGSFAAELKELFHNPDVIISGEITVDAAEAAINAATGPAQSAKYHLRLRATPGQAMASVPRPIGDIDKLFVDAAAMIVESTNPYLAASYYDAVGRLDDAERMIKVCLKDGNDDIKPWALNLRGLIAYQRKDYDKAIEQYKYVNSKYPDFPLSRYNLAQAYLAQASALRAKALGGKDNDEISLIQAEERRLLADAHSIAVEGALHDSNVHSLAIGYNNAGLALLRLAQNRSQYDDALSWFVASTAFDPRYVTAQINQGVVLRDRPSPDSQAAIEKFRLATELDPQNSSGYLNWGVLLRKRDNRADAIAMFENAMRLDPKNETPYYYLGLYQFESEEWDRAEEMFGKAAEINPDWPWYHYYLARTRKSAGKLDAAIVSFKKAVELYPLNHTWIVHLGSALAEASLQQTGANAMKLAEEARTRLNLAVSLAPDDGAVGEIAQQALAMLDTPGTTAGASTAVTKADLSGQDLRGAASDQIANGTRIK
jgi:tetratricopeptide (TPR) repeat protein